MRLLCYECVISVCLLWYHYCISVVLVSAYCGVIACAARGWCAYCVDRVYVVWGCYVIIMLVVSGCHVSIAYVYGVRIVTISRYHCTLIVLLAGSCCVVITLVLCMYRCCIYLHAGVVIVVRLCYCYIRIVVLSGRIVLLGCFTTAVLLFCYYCIIIA